MTQSKQNPAGRLYQKDHVKSAYAPSTRIVESSFDSITLQEGEMPMAGDDTSKCVEVPSDISSVLTIMSTSDVTSSTSHPDPAMISAIKDRPMNCSLSSVCSSTFNQDSFFTSSVRDGEADKKLRFPHKSIMTVRTQDDSVSNSETVLEKRRRKKIHRHAVLLQKGYFKDANITTPLSVSFHPNTVVREYAVGIVDNPSVSGGVPIGLIGECKREYSCSIHEYGHMEDHNNLAIPPKEREIILNLQGVSWKEIHNAVQATNYAIAQRRRKKKNKLNSLSKTFENFVGPSLLSTGHVFSSSQRKLLKECLEFSRRTRIHYDLEEEAILSSKVDSLSLSLKSK